MVAVAEAARDAAVELDQPVDGLGAAVGCAAGVEVGQERFAPLLERLPEPLALWDRAGGQRREDLPTVPRDRHLPSSGSVLPFRIVPSPRNLWGLVSNAVFSIVAVCLLTILLLVCIKGFGYGGNWVDQLGHRIPPNRFPRIPTQPWLALALFVLMVPASIWTVYHFFRQLLKLTGIGPTSIELSSYPLQPGVACRLFVQQTGRVRLQLFDVDLICQEEVTYNQGTDVRTEKAVVYNQRLFRRRGISLDSNSPLESELGLEIPDCAMHSFKSENNRVQWLIVVTAKAKNWPRLRRTFQVMVHPKTHAVTDLISSSEPRSNDVVLRAFRGEADRESKSGKAV